MLHHCKKLTGYRLGATDGEIGKAEDFYFEDQNWTVRYLMADTGYWLPDRLVLLSPHALKQVDETEKILHVELSRQQIEDSPSITADQPVSRRYEREYLVAGWPVYWTGPALWGPGPYPYAPEQNPAPDRATLDESADPHLRSVKEVTGYHIAAQGGELGHVEDFVLEDTNWAIRYLLVRTGHWMPGKRVLIAPQWIETVSWERSAVSVDLPRESIETAPEYDPHTGVTRAYEISLFKHYSREGYWRDRQTAA